MSSRPEIIAKQLTIARKALTRLKRKFGRNLLAVGVTGSVARGTSQKYSDIDMIALLKAHRREHYVARVIEATYVSIDLLTMEEAISQLNRPHPELPEILGGYSKILGLYDPNNLFPTLEAKVRRISPRIFRRSAELALLYSYEDFSRTKNAIKRGDDIVLKDNVYLVTHSAANIVAALNQAHFVSDREIFKAYRGFRRLPAGFERIETLRYGNLKGRRLFRTFLGFYIDLVRFCIKEGVRPPVSLTTLSRV